MRKVQIRNFSGPYFPVFGENAEKYGPEETPILDTFHVVIAIGKRLIWERIKKRLKKMQKMLVHLAQM